MSEEIRLSSSGMHRVCQHDRDCLAFIVGGREHKCGLLEACFLSPKVSRLISSDCTVNRLAVDVDDEKGYFERILGLGCGGSLTLDNENHRVIRYLASSLENLELYGLVTSFELKGEAVNLDNVLRRLSIKADLELDSSEEIAFIASHFYEFADFSSLGLSEFERVLCNEHLKLKDENSLVDIILSLCERDAEYYSLCRYVHIEHVDLSHLETFFEHVYPDHIDGGVWSGISAALRLPFDSESESDVHDLGGTRSPSKRASKPFVKQWAEQFVFEGHPFSGILDKLGAECGGNVHEKGVVHIIPSSVCHHKRFADNFSRVTDYGSNVYWSSDNCPNSWLCFDFKEKAVSVTKYSLKSDGSNGGHLLHWVLEGSRDGIKWTVVNEQCTDCLNRQFVTKTFDVLGDYGPFRYTGIRLRQRGKNSNGGDALMLSEIELFGTLYRRSS